MTPLMYASEKGNPDIVKMLVEAGANINARNPDGWAAILYAVDTGVSSRPIILLLAAHGADLNTKSNRGVTPRSLAQKSGNPDCRTALDDAAAIQKAQIGK